MCVLRQAHIIRLESPIVFNGKNEKYFDVKIYGNADKMTFSASFANGCPYNVTRVEKKDSFLRIWAAPTSGTTPPISADYTLNVKMSEGNEFDILVTEKIKAKCTFKPERTLKITVR